MTQNLDTRTVQSRTVRVLFCAQVLSGLGMGAGMSIGSLLAYEVTGDEGLAGLSRIISGVCVGLFAVPLARLAAARGRRPALVTGWLVAAVGALVLVGAVAWHQLALLFVGMGLFSAGSASGLMTRFAATDLAEPQRRASTLSLVVWATTLGSVLGPNLAAPGAVVGRVLGIADIAGAYLLAAIGTLAAAALVFVALRPDPLVLANRDAPPGPARKGLSGLRPAWAHPDLRLALVTMVCAQFVMAAVMVLTPVHMKLVGLSLSTVGLTMSLHIGGMYAFSPVVGWLVDRLGERRVIAIGLAVFASSLVAAWFAGAALWRLNLALFPLGLGWSLCNVAGSALLTRTAPAAERTQVQGAADTCSSWAAALAAGASGPVMGVVHYSGLAGFAALGLVPVLVALARAPRTP